MYDEPERRLTSITKILDKQLTTLSLEELFKSATRGEIQVVSADGKVQFVILPNQAQIFADQPEVQSLLQQIIRLSCKVDNGDIDSASAWDIFSSAPNLDELLLAREKDTPREIEL